MSLYCASAFFGSVFASFLASAIRAESAGAMVDCLVVVDSEMLSVGRVFTKAGVAYGAVPELNRKGHSKPR